MEFGILAKAVSSSSNDAIRKLTLSLLLNSAYLCVTFFPGKRHVHDGKGSQWQLQSPLGFPVGDPCFSFPVA